MELQKYIIGIISTVLYLREVHAFVNVRLENGNRGPHEGSVEITKNGYDWEIICGSSEFDIYDVIVICRQLGYPGANWAFTSSPYQAGDYPMSTTAFHCTGTETHLNNCEVRATSCTSPQVAGALCYARDSGYLGCFNDEFYNPVLTATNVVEDGMTVSRCVNFCKINGFYYAGLKLSTKCFCGGQHTFYNRYGQTSDADCQYSCGGSRYESCGGYTTISIYRVANDAVTMRPMTTITSYFHSRQTGTLGYGYNNTQPEVSHGYPSTPAVTVRMVAKEGNFINQPSGIAVVISLSVATIILILIVIFLVRRRSSQPDPKRKPSNRPYEEITLEVQEMENPGTTPNAYCETGDVPLNTPLVAPPNHNYEHAELFSPGERTSEMYSTVPDVQDHSSAEPNGRSKPETPPAIRDLYAKPMKETARVQGNDTSYETIDDEDLRIDPKTYLGGPQDIANGRDEQLENDTGYSKLQNGTNAHSNLDLDEMYAKPLKKEHRKVVKEDSFDETVMVENELYTSTDSKA